MVYGGMPANQLSLHMCVITNALYREPSETEDEHASGRNVASSIV